MKRKGRLWCLVSLLLAVDKGNVSVPLLWEVDCRAAVSPKYEEAVGDDPRSEWSCWFDARNLFQGPIMHSIYERLHADSVDVGRWPAQVRSKSLTIPARLQP